MNKTQIKHFEDQITKVSRCLTGKVESEYNDLPKQFKPEIDCARARLIQDGIAEFTGSIVRTYTNVIDVFDFKQKDLDHYVGLIENENKKIEEETKLKIEERDSRTKVIEDTGRHLLDSMVAGLIDIKAMPDEIEKFAQTKF